jgi:hypothetical protein
MPLRKSFMMKLKRLIGTPDGLLLRVRTLLPVATLTVLLFACMALSAAASGAPRPAYETGSQDVSRLTRDLCRSLGEAELRKWPLAAHFKDASTSPPELLGAEKLEFLNQITHAKAIDSMKRGFFRQYAEKLSVQAASFPLLELSEWNDSKFRGLRTMNSQISYFNQIAGSLVAIDMAHHYLGHYEKYAARLAKNAGTNAHASINSFLTAEEWHQAILRGAHHALTCGLSVEGLLLLYDLVALQPNQPSWVAHFVSPTANLPKVKRDLQKMEADYFGLSSSKPNRMRPDLRLRNPAEW